VPVHYTGFVVPPEPPRPAARREGVIVSSGGGLVGGPLVRAAVEAHRIRWRHSGQRTRIVAGPFLPDEEWRWLQRQAPVTPGLEVVRSVHNLRDELARAAVSVSQGGYNTTLDLLRSRVPALVVPFTGVDEDEQTRRTRSLEDLGALRMLAPELLDGPRLAAALDAMRDFRPSAVDIDLDGGARSAELLEQALSAREEVAA